ncbi:ribosomal protein L33 [Streptomyces prasinopilosus]|uniref:Large ribosomal subunit protein bL33 n=1 Tax=Streptomyces prasinopilosus TaxID=67344 RepID=A0A1G6Y6G4_9ACTN|nr:ribosomal protein L33 [Streptomyces prasinopilosus]
MTGDDDFSSGIGAGRRRSAVLACSDDFPSLTGCVGAGTGTVAPGFKAGIDTASRTPDVGDRRFTAGVLVQANFGGALRGLGRIVTPRSPSLEPDDPAPAPLAETGSCMIVVATDAPARRPAAHPCRAKGGVHPRTHARTGAAYGHGSCDYAVAFGTRPNAVACAADTEPGPLSTARPVVRLKSAAGTGVTYVTRKNRLNDPDQLVLRKYDPVAGEHVLFREER